MSGRISASSPPAPPPLCRTVPSTNIRYPTRLCNPAWRSASTRASRDRHSLLSHSALELKLNGSFRCNSSSTPGGERDSKRVLDAFFLGKALAEALSERIESTVGEFLSTVGRLQAEQQKQVQDFQEEVLERAKKAKEKAAREAMEAQGLISKSPTSNISTFTNGVAAKSEQRSVPVPPSNSSASTTSNDENSTDTDPLVGISIDD